VLHAFGVGDDPDSSARDREGFTDGAKDQKGASRQNVATSVSAAKLHNHQLYSRAVLNEAFMGSKNLRENPHASLPAEYASQNRIPLPDS
jgi:hypothetical protein